MEAGQMNGAAGSSSARAQARRPAARARSGAPRTRAAKPRRQPRAVKREAADAVDAFEAMDEIIMAAQRTGQTVVRSFEQRPMAMIAGIGLIGLILAMFFGRR